MISDRYFMQKAVSLAGRGMNLTSPNPRVGCVIVKEGRVIGQGYHKKFGSLHAEAEALTDANMSTEGATLFVTLEPCSHTGKTPPCSEAIINAGIKRVVVGVRDPSPEINGIESLRENKVEVTVGVMAKECAEIIRDFIKFRNEKKPYVTLKSALSLDGKIATRTGQSRWISSGDSRRYTMKMRGRSDAVIVGAQTANSDNPALTYRLDEPAARDPLRIIVDGRLSVGSDLEIIREGTVVMAFADADRESEKVLAAKGAKVIRLPAKEGTHIAPADILAELYKMDIMSILIEGGGTTSGAFLDAGEVDSIVFIYAPALIGGAGAPGVYGGRGAEKLSNKIELKNVELFKMGEDIVVKGDIN